MANRFGMDYTPLTDEERQKEYPLIASIMSEPCFSSQSRDQAESVISATQSSTQIQNVTPDRTGDKKGKYTVKKGSMTDMRMKRTKREREKRACQLRLIRMESLTTNKSKKTRITGVFGTREDVSSSQKTMTQSFPTRRELENKVEVNRQFEVAHSKPHPFDPRDEVSDKAFIQINRMGEEYLFEKFLEREAKKSLETQSSKKKRKKQKGGEKRLAGSQTICEGCGNSSGMCHNVQYGRYCMDAVRAYHHSNKGLGIETCQMVGRKIFVEHYSYALHFNEYDATSDSLHEIKWASLPYCLKELSYDNIVDWLGWAIDGKWQEKGKKIPEEWLNI